MILLPFLLLLLLAPSPEELNKGLEEADKLAAQARVLEDDARKKGVAKALKAYDALIALRPKDRRFVPRVRRRKASLLKREKRIEEALAEYDKILTGRARRKEKARALYEGARLLPPKPAIKRLQRALAEYRDITANAAKSSLLLGKTYERLKRVSDAERAYRYVIDRCADEAKEAITAYDRLALLCIAHREPEQARRWLRTCVRRFEKRASRGDKYGGYISRLLGDMRAPRKLTEALADR